MNYLFIFILLLIFIFFILPFFFNQYITNINKDKNLLDLFNYDGHYLAFKKNKIKNKYNSLVFLPHPFTNWTLNPSYKNSKNNYVHTLEGFRKTSDENSLIELIKKYPNSKKIVCIGGSTTHCQEMEEFEATWPALIQSKFSKNKVLIFNFGVGGWSTIQSLIRCSNWFSLINPDILVFYQAKNDLTPLLNGCLDEEFIYNDYQNVIGQFGESITNKYPFFLKKIPLFKSLYKYTDYLKKFKEYGLLNIYRPKAEFSEKGLLRLNDDYISSILFRKKTIFKMCSEINCKVLYIPEIVIEGPYKKLLENKIYPNVKKMIDDYNNVEFYNINSFVEKNKINFLDKMHFTIAGNKLISEIIYNKLTKMLNS